MAEDKNTIKKMMDMMGEVANQRKAERAQLEEDRKNLVAAIGKDLSSVLVPALKELSNQSRISRTELASALREAFSELVINVSPPQVMVDVPMIKVPTPQVTVNPPVVNIPPIKVPEAIVNMPDFINAKLHGISTKFPLPVILTNERGEPYSAGSMMMSGGGGVNAFKQSVVLVRDFVTSTGASLIDPDGRLKISGGGGGAVTIADAIEVKQVSGFIDSVSIKSSDVSFEVKQVSGFTNSVSISQQDFTFDVKQVSGSSNSVNVVSQDITLDVRQISGATDSVAVKSVDVSLEVKQVSGFVDSVSVVAQDFTFDMKQVSGATDSVAIKSSDVSFEVKQVSGFNDSVYITGASSTIMIVGDKASDVADDEANPVMIGGVARTANPAVVAAGDSVSATFDTIGRQVMRPLQVRGLLTTAYATLSSNAETTLLAGAASTYHDLIYIAFANTSSVALNVDLRDATGTGILATFALPANATAGVSLTPPIPQNVAADTWTVKFNASDISNTTVYANALFAKEV